MANSKVVYYGNVLIDLTSDTVDAAHLLTGSTAHDKSGAAIEGTCAYDSDTSSDTAAQAEILVGKTAHARGAQLTGTMPNIGKQSSVTISTKAQQITIAQGYHDGSAKVSIATAEQNKVVAGNIKKGVVLLGVEGTYTGESTEVPQSKTVNAPLSADLTVTPDTGYTCLSQVVIKKVPYTTAANSAGGTTVTIG